MMILIIGYLSYEYAGTKTDAKRARRKEIAVHLARESLQRPTGLRRPIWAENPILIAGTVRFAEQDWHSM